MSRLTRRSLLLASPGLGVAAVAAGCASKPAPAGPAPFLVDLDRDPDRVIDLWPNGAPGGENTALNQHFVHRDNAFGLKDRAVHEVTHPTLSLFRSPSPNGSVMLIIPGGGYSWVVVEKEGFEGARYFNTFGYDVYVMSYRLPHQGWSGGPDTPLQDAQRAVRVIRSRAAEEGHRPDRLIVAGFSAGGHVAGSLCQRFDAPVYPAADAADALSARPDLGALIYPVASMDPAHAHPGSRRNLIGETPDSAVQRKYDLTTAPSPDGPPLFLLHTLDDEAVPVENTLMLAAACRAAGVDAVTHTFRSGGHGFGLRGIDGTPVAVWPKLLMDWAREYEAQESSTG